MPRELLIIDPEAIQIGEMTDRYRVALVPVSKGRNGKDYFRFGSGSEILRYEPSLISRPKGDRVYLELFKEALWKRYVPITEAQRDRFTVGVNVDVENGVLRYDYRELAVWATFETSVYRISYRQDSPTNLP